MVSRFLLQVAAGFVLLCAVQPARAEVAAYGAIGYTAYGYTREGGSLDTGPGRVGGTVGGFYNFPIQSRFTAGIDGRFGGALHSGDGFRGSAAARFGFVPHRVPLRPYFQIGGGFVGSRFEAPVTSGGVELGFGLDVRLTSHWDWRALEFEGVAGAGDRGAAGSSVSTGVVYHFSNAAWR